MFRHRRSLRLWAALALLLWLAVFGVGVAKACLGVDTSSAVHAPSPSITTKGAEEPAAAHAGSHTVVSSLTATDQAAFAETDPLAQANCRHELCGKSAVWTPLLKWSGDNLHAHAIHVPERVIAVPMPIYSSAPRWLPHRNGVLPLPISIAFLRLAL